MKNLFFVILIFTISTSAFSLTGKTKTGYAACISEQFLNDFVDFANSKDIGSMKAYINSSKCINMKEGIKVTVTDQGFFKSEFVYNGVKLWTVREGISYI